MIIKKIFAAFIFCFLSSSITAQITGQEFLQYQLTFPRVSQAYNSYNNLLLGELKSRGFVTPVNNILIRSFKAQNQMEIWIKNPNVDTFALFKNYDVCALSGILGPKRKEGDLQVPEGFYFITEFNPRSDFYLSLYVNYPNYSDAILGNKEKPGGDIFIHGGCVTVGCLPMTDRYIQELYVLCLMARTNGQNNIPVHIFPTRFEQETVDYLNTAFQKDKDEEKHRFWLNIKSGYDYFNKYKKILPVMYNVQGKYIY